MIASSPLWLKPHSLRLINYHLLPTTRCFGQQASARFVAHLPPPQAQTSTKNRRPFTSSAARPAPQDSPQSISGEDWEELSPEEKVQWMGDDRWGWVIYRCSYAREFDGAWDDLKRRVQQGIRDSVADSGAPGISDTMDFVFVEDAALEDASVEELRRRFRAWAREDRRARSDLVDATRGSRGSRYEYFVKVDGEGLWNGHVSLVRAWPDSPGSEDWMKVRSSAVAAELYVELDDPEMWYVHYRPPENGMSSF